MYYENDVNIFYCGLLLVEYEVGGDYNFVLDDYYLIECIVFDINYEWLLFNDVILNIFVYWSDVSCDYWCYSVDIEVLNEVNSWVYIDSLIGNNCLFECVGIEICLILEYSFMGVEVNSEFGLCFM